MTNNKIPVIASIAALAQSCDVWFVDVWGVIHNGVQPFASAVVACIAFRNAGGIVILVSNSPRPRDALIKQLDGVGVDPAAYDEVITSGDVSRDLIRNATGPVYHIGPKRDLPLFEGLDISFAGVEGATVAVCTGLFDDETENPSDYAQTLSEMHRRGLPMICANPDITAERGGKIIYCAGAIAQAYSALGGDVSYAGKPHAPIYVAAIALARKLRGAGVENARILAIGDGIATDIRGASQAGLRSVFIASGIHVAANVPLAEAAAVLFANEAVSPVAAMTALAW